MKIKQIEWDVVRVGTQMAQVVVHHTTFLDSFLPLGHYAKIRGISTGVKWSIAKGGMHSTDYVVSGVEDTLQEAEDACQKAWEELVIEVLEVSEGCEYCTMPATPLILDEWVHDDIGDVRALLETEICGNKLMTCADIRFEYREGAKEINYCPMCGRKLEETE